MLLVLFLTGGVLALLALLERRWSASPDPVERLENVAAYALTTAVQVAALPWLDLKLVVPSFLDLAAWPFLSGLIAFTLCMDLGEFLFHRAQHAVPFLWRMHALHHSDPNMNASTALRHFWGDPLVKAVTIWPACWMIARPTPAILAAYALISFYHLFVHANLRVGFGRLSWALNSPAYHRRHHSADPRHHGCNFASLFPIFDVVLGTYRRPDGFPATGDEARPASLTDMALWPLRNPAKG